MWRMIELFSLFMLTSKVVSLSQKNFTHLLKERPCGHMRCVENLLWALKKGFLSPKREPRKTRVSHPHPLMPWCLVDRLKPPWPCDSQTEGSQRWYIEASWNEPSFDGSSELLELAGLGAAWHLDFLIHELNIYLWFMSWGFGVLLLKAFCMILWVYLSDFSLHKENPDVHTTLQKQALAGSEVGVQWGRQRHSHCQDLARGRPWAGAGWESSILSKLWVGKGMVVFLLY